MTRSRRLARLVWWWAAVAGCLAVLMAAGGTPVGMGRPWSGESWIAALEHRGPVITAMAAARLLGLGLAWYVVAAALLAGGLRRWHSRGLERALSWTCVGPLRRWVVALTGATVVAPALSATAPASAPALAVTAATQAPVAGDAVTMRLVEPDGPGPPAPVADEPPPLADGHVVVAGESFWSIASDAVAHARGAKPCDAEVAGYWLELIEVNRHHLVDRANPDLIYPGQVFSLPPVPGG